MAEVLICRIEVIEFEIQSRCYVPYGTNTFGKAETLLFPQLSIKYHHCFSACMVLVANEC